MRVLNSGIAVYYEPGLSTALRRKIDLAERERREGKIVLPSKYRRPEGLWRIVTIGVPVAAITIAVLYIFYLRPFGFSITGLAYLFTMMAAFLPLVFIWDPATKKSPRKKVPWYDIVLAIISCVTPLYFVFNQEPIQKGWWEWSAPLTPLIMASTLWVLIMEACRRSGGLTLFICVVIIGFFPLYSCYVPFRILWGPCMDFTRLVCSQVINPLGIMSVTMSTFGHILIGYMVFAVSIQAVGAGQFFTDVALTLVGKTRCGNAKVAVLASAFFGTISGAAVPNVMTTGTFTIPAMKKEGLPPEFAGAVEATASAAGGITPPVMASAAFVMSEFTGIPYANICIAAAVPAAMFYLCVFSQIDAFAARIGLKAPQVTTKPPPVWKALLKNYHIVLGMATLIYILFFLRMNHQAPYYAVVVTLVLSLFQKRTRMSFNAFLKFIESTGRILAFLLAILASVGVFIGSMTFTGIALSIPQQIVALGGGNVLAILIVGALANIILGLPLTTTAVYIFLAIVLAPGLVALGLSIMAVHLYIIYIGEFSHTTPPVALAAMAASSIAECDFMKVCWNAMKLGTAKYILPFIFVISPTLILQGSISDILWAIPTACIGFVVIGGALEGYFWFIGNIRMTTRFALFAAGFLMVLPATSLGVTVNLVGIGIFVAIFALVKLAKQSQSPLAKVFVS